MVDIEVRRPGRRRTRGGVPIALALPAAVAFAFLVLPLAGLLVRAPWSTLGSELASTSVHQALRLSLVTATLATIASLVLGIPLAWFLARVDFRGRRLVRALVTLPLVLPPVVGGVALFLVLGRHGLLGQWLDRWFGITIPFTTAAVVIAEAFVAMPFLIISVEGALRAGDVRYEEAAATLGASRWTTFRRVTLPLVAPAVAAGTVLCWARALGEFGATITFAGNFPGTTQTMPLAVYLALETRPAGGGRAVRGAAGGLGAGARRSARSLGEPNMSLFAKVQVRRGAFALDLDLSVAAGEVVVLLGPNGAGKTTTLRALAGLVPLTDGRVELDDEVLDDVSGRRHVPTERRPIGVVFQDYRLFPHLSAAQNVAFGLRSRGVAKAQARAIARQWLAQVGLGEFADAKPGVLSGGQAQRVALARALAPGPRLLLLDEPLAALDAGTRSDVRSDLRRHLAAYSGCTVVVTHDPLDAMILADRLVVLEGGVVVQEGPPAQIARHPRTQYVARLVGLNLFAGYANGSQVALRDGGQLTVADEAHGEVLVAVRPDAVSLFRTRPDGSPRNVWAARVAGVEMHGDRVRVAVEGPVQVLADITPGALAELGLGPGSEVWVAVKASETAVYRA